MCAYTYFKVELEIIDALYSSNISNEMSEVVIQRVAGLKYE
jgi:hypothetical protein